MRWNASEEAALWITANWKYLKRILWRHKRQQDAELNVLQLLQRSYQVLKSDTKPTFRKLGLKRHCEMTVSPWRIWNSLIFCYFLYLRNIFVVLRVKLYCSSLLQGSDHPHYIHISSLQSLHLEQTNFSYLRKSMGTALAPGYFPSLWGVWI